MPWGPRRQRQASRSSWRTAPRRSRRGGRRFSSSWSQHWPGWSDPSSDLWGVLRPRIRRSPIPIPSAADGPVVRSVNRRLGTARSTCQEHSWSLNEQACGIARLTHLRERTACLERCASNEQTFCNDGDGNVIDPGANDELDGGPSLAGPFASARAIEGGLDGIRSSTRKDSSLDL